jgi:predicted RNA-binding protein YlqC (UPF0109 family)
MSQPSGSGASPSGSATPSGLSPSGKKLSELAKMIEYMAKMLVDLPDQVEVNEIAGENTTVIELKVAKEDLGKIIGKQGRTARAVRTVLNGASTKLRKRTVLEIIE